MSCPLLSLSLLVVGLSLLPACAANDRTVQSAAVVRRAAFDFQCAEDEIVASHFDDDLFTAEGCGKRAMYDANGRCSADDNCSAVQSGPVNDAPPGRPVPGRRR